MLDETGVSRILVVILGLEVGGFVVYFLVQWLWNNVEIRAPSGCGVVALVILFFVHLRSALDFLARR